MSVERRMTLTLTESVEVTSNRKSVCDVIFDGNTNVYPICHNLEIVTVEMYMILTFKTGQGQT